MVFFETFFYKKSANFATSKFYYLLFDYKSQLLKHTY